MEEVDKRLWTLEHDDNAAGDSRFTSTREVKLSWTVIRQDRSEKRCLSFSSHAEKPLHLFAYIHLIEMRLFKVFRDGPSR